jgi:hypothetical protein
MDIFDLLEQDERSLSQCFRSCCVIFDIRSVRFDYFTAL